MLFAWYMKKRLIFSITQFHPGNISLLSLTRLISTHQKAFFWCLTQLHINFQLVVYPAGQSTYQSLFPGIIVYNYKDFCQIVPKFDTYIYLWLPTCAPNFSWIEACIPKLEQFLCLCEKKKKLNFGLSYFRNGWRDFLQIWNVAFHYRQILPL